jgi:crotonobetainyl-CoA:carnitine CoA-transferase CaiB-like acyl-CoA transferase
MHLEMALRAAQSTIAARRCEAGERPARTTHCRWIAHCLKDINAAGVPCGPIYSIDQMFADAQVEHLGIAQDVSNAEGRHIRLVGQPVTLSRTPSKMVARPPEFGEQTDEVLAEFGVSSAEIAELRQAKVVYLRRRRLKATEFMPFGMFLAPAIWIGWLLEALSS